jgi:hypothetical protein
VHERSARVHGAGEDLLTHAALSLEEHRHVRLRGALEDREEVPHRRRHADRVPEGHAGAQGQIQRRRLHTRQQARLPELDGRVRCEEHIGDAQASDPRAVLAPLVAHPDAGRLEGEAHVLARDGAVGQP